MENQNRLPRILIVDESRLLRAMLIRHIRDLYEFREESNGEAAWQALVLDHSIKLVICSLSLPVLDGDSLLVRVRASRLPRLAQMPMLMIAGDNEEAIERARSHGASDFIGRTTWGSPLLARIAALLKLAQAQDRLRDEAEQHVQNSETGLFTRKYIELQVAQSMSHAMRHNSEVCAMVLGFDGAAALREEHGEDLFRQVHRHLVSILAGRIRKEDSLGHYVGSQLVVVAPGISLAAGEGFANRLREAVSSASVAVGGKRLSLTASIGVANSPADTVMSAGALIELAAARLKAAQEAGGNVVASGVATGAAPSPAAVLPAAPTVERAIALLSAGQEGEVIPHLAPLAGQILPLLKLIERELKLGLPLAALEKAGAGRTPGRADDQKG